MTISTQNTCNFQSSGELYPSALILYEPFQDYYRGCDHQYEEFPHQMFAPSEVRYLAEIELLKVMQDVLDKPKWERKLLDPEIWEKWKQEARDAVEERCRTKQEGLHGYYRNHDECSQKYRLALTDDVLDYAFDELKCCADLKDQSNGMEWSGVDLIWKSDTLIPLDLHDQLSTLVDGLIAESPDKDWCPDNLVLDIVHPSLFCLVYDRSTTMDGSTFNGPKKYYNGAPGSSPITSRRNSTSANPAPAPPKENTTNFADNSAASDDQPLAESYDMLKHVCSGLYPIIARIFSSAIPLFERVLNDLSHNRRITRFIAPGDYSWYKEGGSHDYIPYEIYDGTDEDDLEAMDRAQREFLEREFEPLPIPKFDPKIRTRGIIPGTCVDDCPLKLINVQLQVIVKIESINLTPERSRYDGGKWRIDGMANEKIVATCIYYYDSDNIEGDSLQFRQPVTMDFVVEQGDNVGVSVMFDVNGQERLIQDLGGVKTPSGRVVCFPNLYQYIISPFSLKDPTKPGHRKILVFFLVDPTQQVVCTEDIPPQDIRWLEKDMESVVRDRLPPELRGMIAKQYGGMTLAEAKKHRLASTKERSKGNQVLDKVIFGAEYGFGR